MSLLLEISNPANWQLIHDQRYQAAIGPDPPDYEIFEDLAPVQAESRILSCWGDSPYKKVTWNLAYWLSARVLSDGQLVTVAETKIPLNKWKLFILPPYASTFTLQITIPYWFWDMSTKIKEYTGPFTDEVIAFCQEQLDLVRIDLLRIEGKIEQINQALSNP